MGFFSRNCSECSAISNGYLLLFDYKTVDNFAIFNIYTPNYTHCVIYIFFVNYSNLYRNEQVFFIYFGNLHSLPKSIDNSLHLKHRSGIRYKKRPEGVK